MTKDNERKRMTKIMAFFNRFTATTRGGIRFVGNTLGLSKLTNQNSAGTQGSIGAFTTLLGGTVSNFPAETTLTFADNGSAAILNLPAGSDVLYAELVWGGNYRSATQNISGQINNPIGFTNPQNNTVSITQSPVTAQNFTYTDGSLTLGYYIRSANVTSVVQASGNGTYSVRGVPGLVDPIDNNTQDTNHAGWTLAVVYQNDAETLSNLNLWIGGEIVSPNTPSVDVTFSNFLTPASGPVSARVFLSASEGDAVLTGDQCLLGPNAGTLTNLSGPRNPAQNFFASQICNETGQLDTTGTFGTRNANPQTGTNISAGRQGWDITSVDGSAGISNSQTSAVFRFTSTGDLYIPNALGIKIDSQGAVITAVKSADKSFAFVGEEIAYSLQINNSGQISAQNVLVQDTLPPGLTLIPGSLSVNGVPQAGGFPVTVPDIPAGGAATVTFRAVANTIPDPNPTLNSANVQYTFYPFPDFPVENDETSNPVSVRIVTASAELFKSVDRAYAVLGDVLTYTVNLSNTGMVDLIGLVFRDPIPAGTTFVADSVTVNGVSQPGYEPDPGFPLGTLVAGGQVTVTFQVTVN